MLIDWLYILGWSLIVAVVGAPYDRVSGTLVIRDVHTLVPGVQT